MNFGMDYQGDTGGNMGGGGGGGYSQGGGFGGGGSQDSSGSPDKKRRNYDEQTLIPVNIVMANKATDSEGNLTLEDGRSLHTIKIIAAVRQVEEQSTCVVWTLEDATGTIEAKQWMDDNDPSIMTEMRKDASQDNIYVKVIGQLKDFNHVKTLMVNSIIPVRTGNQLAHHSLEVMYSAEKFKRADSIVQPVMPAHNTLGGGLGLSGGAGAAMGAAGGENDAKQRVMQVMQQHSNESEEGVNIERCFHALPDISQAEVRKHVNELAEEGCIYSTINEFHYKAAE